MAHYYEQNITCIEEKYSTFLINILTPLLYEGIVSAYQYAVDKDTKMKENGEKSLGPLKIFQQQLEYFPSLNEEQIAKELERIKVGSKCYDIFDDLVKAVIKSSILLLTFNVSYKKSPVVESKYHETVSVSNFVHKCYIECAKVFYNTPGLFWHKYPPIVIKNNQAEICNMIKLAVKEAIMKMLPMKMVLNEFLQNDYNDENELIGIQVNRSDYERIKELLTLSKKSLYEGHLARESNDSESENYDNEYNDDNVQHFNIVKLNENSEEMLEGNHFNEVIVDDDEHTKYKNVSQLYNEKHKKQPSVEYINIPQMGTNRQGELKNLQYAAQEMMRKYNIPDRVDINDINVHNNDNPNVHNNQIPKNSGNYNNIDEKHDNSVHNTVNSNNKHNNDNNKHNNDNNKHNNDNSNNDNRTNHNNSINKPIIENSKNSNNHIENNSEKVNYFTRYM